jgi:hypothetical protein
MPREAIRAKRLSELTPEQREAKEAADKAYRDKVDGFYADLPPAGDPTRETRMAEAKALKDAEWGKYKTDAVAGGWWEEKTKQGLLDEVDGEIQAHQDTITALQAERAEIEARTVASK